MKPGTDRPGVADAEHARALLRLPDAALFASAARLRVASFGNGVHLCAIINIRSGGCDMDCRFCAQSSHYAAAGGQRFGLLDEETLRGRILTLAATPVRRIGLVSSGGALGGADFERVIALLRSLPAGVRGRLCASLGRLDTHRLARLADAGLTRYHHNLETAQHWYPRICSTQRWEARRATALAARDAGLGLCCGGLFGLGESWTERLEFAFSLREMGVTSVPMNFLHPQPGTPLAGQTPLSADEALRIIAVFRHILPTASLRVCGGRPLVLGARQAELFAAGANALMTGDYLTTRGEALEADLAMIAATGMVLAPDAAAAEGDAHDVV